MLNYCSPIFLHVLLLSFNASIWRFFYVAFSLFICGKKAGIFYEHDYEWFYGFLYEYSIWTSRN